MTTYITIADSQIDPEAPITSELMSQLRDNPIAAFEGASGAPKLEDAALSTTVTTAGQAWVVARNIPTFNQVGSYAFAIWDNAATNTDYAPNATISGSALTAAGVYQTSTNTSAGPSDIGQGGVTAYSIANLSGTWRCMGYMRNYTISDNAQYGATLFVRIA